jgi:hypothetical protein
MGKRADRAEVTTNLEEDNIRGKCNVCTFGMKLS